MNILICNDDGYLAQGIAVLARVAAEFANVRAVFVIGVARGEEDDAVEFEFVGECAGDVGVPFVYRVEGAAEKADARTHAGFTAHSVLPFTMRASLPVVGWMTRPCTGM